MNAPQQNNQDFNAFWLGEISPTTLLFCNVFLILLLHSVIKVKVKGKVKCTLVQGLRLCTSHTAHGGIEV